MPKCATGQIVSISFPIFKERCTFSKYPHLFHLKSYPAFVNNKSSSFLTITKIVSTFFSLQKLEALDFITMLSQWSSFSSQKVQIRFFAPSLDFPPIFIPAFFYLARKWVTHPIPFVVARGEKCCFDAAFFCVFPRLRRSRYKKMLAKRNVKNILKLLLRHIVNSINKEEVE